MLYLEIWDYEAIKCSKCGFHGNWPWHIVEHSLRDYQIENECLDVMYVCSINNIHSWGVKLGGYAGKHYIIGVLAHRTFSSTTVKEPKQLNTHEVNFCPCYIGTAVALPRTWPHSSMNTSLAECCQPDCTLSSVTSTHRIQLLYKPGHFESRTTT